MIKQILILFNCTIAGMILSFSLVAMAKNPNTKLSTDVKFDGQTVGGKIQSPFESLTVVENEKSIDDLIGVRKNFADRIQKSKGMR
jgi:hypothetical protein